MAETWKASTSGTTYEVRVGPDHEIEFSTEATGNSRFGRRSESDQIWAEEFPHDDHRKEWIRERLGEGKLVEIQQAVARELEELATRREEVFDGAIEILEEGSGDRPRAVDRIRSLAVRYGDLADRAVEELAERIEDDDERLRRSAAEALRRIADHRAEAVEGEQRSLRRALGDDQPNVRLDAARTLVLLSRVGEERPDEQLLEEVVETLVGLLHEHTRWFSQGPVAGLLGELGREHPIAVEPAVEPMVRFVVGELTSGSATSGIGRSTAVQALAEIGENEPGLIVQYVDVFLDEIGNDRPGVRGRCIEALGALASQNTDLASLVVPSVAARLEETDFVRSAALEALRRIRRAAPEVVRGELEEDQLEALEASRMEPI